MWQIEPTAKFRSKFNRYKKKHPNEVKAALNNLDTYLHTLNAVDNPLLVKGGWIHPEPKGVIAIDQKGGKGKLRQTRLYLYAEPENKVVHLLTIGDKNTQKNDIKDCATFVKQIRSKKNG